MGEYPSCAIFVCPRQATNVMNCAISAPCAVPMVTLPELSQAKFCAAAWAGTHWAMK